MDITFTVERHGFGLDEIFDGRGLSKLTRERKAKEADFVLILTSASCRSARHRIRTRAGHCAQCKPSSIGFTKRERSTGYVYLAGSSTGRLIKVGTAKNIDQRQRQLRGEGYGGFSDWVILIARSVENAGTQERNVANRIRGERIVAPYWKDGELQRATEMIQCSFGTALASFEAILGKVLNKAYLLRRHAVYNFVGEQR